MTTIWIKTSFVGFHHWPEAPDELTYLRNLHRHVFGVQVCARVSHSDRDLEFHILKGATNYAITFLQEALRSKPLMSCEMMAEFLYMHLRDDFPSISSIGVDEDDECGAVYVPGR